MGQYRSYFLRLNPEVNKIFSFSCGKEIIPNSKDEGFEIPYTAGVYDLWDRDFRGVIKTREFVERIILGFTVLT